MTKFQQYTPHAATEQLMSEAPGASQKGGGRRKFRYTKEMCDCSLCAERPCPGVALCPYFDEYLEAGAWQPSQLLRRWLTRIKDPELRQRILTVCGNELRLYQTPEHLARLRWAEASGLLKRQKRPQAASLFLLAVNKRLWKLDLPFPSLEKESAPRVDAPRLDAIERWLLYTACLLSSGATEEIISWLERIVDDGMLRLCVAALLVYEYGLPEFDEGGVSE